MIILIQTNITLYSLYFRSIVALHQSQLEGFQVKCSWGKEGGGQPGYYQQQQQQQPWQQQQQGPPQHQQQWGGECIMFFKFMK